MVKKAEICLVNMPFVSIYGPSLALGLLKAAAEESGIRTVVEYANLYFMDMLGEESNNWDLWLNSMSLMVEMLFQPYAGYDSYASVDETVEVFCQMSTDSRTHLRCREIGESCKRLQDKVDAYLDQMVEKVLAHEPALVGCTYTFQQCNSILSLFKRLKEKRPEIITVIGGCGVTGNAGPALLDAMPQIDYAFLGESDDVFADACRLMMLHDDDTLFQRYSCVIKKGRTGSYHAIKDMDSLIYPDFEEYFHTLSELKMDAWVQPVVPMETSRGCWWGSKHKCGFCGLHTDSAALAYRRKSVFRAAEEMNYLSDRYGIKKFMLTDSILSYEHIRDLPPLLEKRGYTIWAEVKSNMTREQLYGLKKAGIIYLQPGIESLHDEVLALMGKGNTAIRHVELLKNAKAEGVYLTWNLLKGHPGEKSEWYAEMIELMQCLHHLQAPSNNSVVFQRQSEYTIHREKYGISLTIMDYYPYLFGRDMGFLERFAENFRRTQEDTSYYAAVEAEVESWQEEKKTAGLFYVIQNGIMGISDTRKCALQRRYAFSGLEKDICELADEVIQEDKLFAALADRYGEEAVRAAVDALMEYKLLIKIRGEYLFLAVPRKVK